MLEFVDSLGGSSGPYGLSKQYKENTAELSINKVQCCGVDELVFERNIDMPDFIKFDLESAEESHYIMGTGYLQKKGRWCSWNYMVMWQKMRRAFFWSVIITKVILFPKCLT